MSEEVKAKKPRRKPKAFIKRYGRVMIGGLLIGIVAFFAVFADFIAPFDPNEVHLDDKFAKPNETYYFGTDSFGRDIFSRVVYGSQTSLFAAITVNIIVIAVGASLGLICGYYPKADLIIMRVFEVMNSIPRLLLTIVVASVLGTGWVNLIMSLVVTNIPGPAKYVRAQVLSIKRREFVESEKAMGASVPRTLFLHILPHCSSYLLLRFSSGLSGVVSSMASLSYLGVGLDPSIPNWGAIISAGQGMMLIYPHLVVSAGVAISLTVFGFCMLGDGLRDILDPKLR